MARLTLREGAEQIARECGMSVADARETLRSRLASDLIRTAEGFSEGGIFKGRDGQEIHMGRSYYPARSDWWKNPQTIDWDESAVANPDFPKFLLQDVTLATEDVSAVVENLRAANDPFQVERWNLWQLRAWVCARDEALVRETGELACPGSVAIAVRTSRDKSAIMDISDTKEEIASSVRSGKITLEGPDGQGDLKKLPGLQSPTTKLVWPDKGEPFAEVETAEGEAGELRGLMVRSADARRQWPPKSLSSGDGDLLSWVSLDDARHTVAFGTNPAPADETSVARQDKADADIRDWATSEKLRVTGRRREGSPVESVPGINLRDAEFLVGNVVMDGSAFGLSHARWVDVKVSRDNLLACIRAATTAAPEQEEQAKVPAVARSDEVEVWYIEWVKGLQASGRRSSRKGDVDAARQKFGINLPEKAVRPLRKKYAPPEWQEGGAPRRAGRAQEPGKK